MATQITATLPTLDFPLEADYPTQEDWAAFSAAAELNFGILGGSWSEQMQLWKTEANAMSTELNNNSNIAQSVANYQGDWVSQGYTLGQSVSVSEIYYVCKLTHATGQNPTDIGSIYWNLVIGNWNLKADKTEVALKIDKDMSAYTTKSTPIDADLIPLSDSAASFGIKKLSWANLKATLDSTWVANDARVKTALNAIGTAPIYACRAWVNFNGTGTVAIRASGNVSSVTDNGAGNHTVNFATAMPDANYAVATGAKQNTDTAPTLSVLNPTNYLTSSITVVGSNSAQSATDHSYCNVSIYK